MKLLDDLVTELCESMTFGQPERGPEEYEGNPVGLDEEATKGICRELNRHQASLFVLFHQYQKHHWLVEGPQWRDLHLYLEEAYKQIHADLDAVAERITALGAIPSASLKALSQKAYVVHEPEGFYPIRSSLQHDLRAEAVIAKALRLTIENAERHGDYGTGHILKGVLTRTEDRAHHLDHYLASDNLSWEVTA